MAEIPSARQSPRITNGVLKWYQGDTFELSLELALTDQDGEPVTIGASDTVEIVFRDKKNATIKTFTYANITGSTVTLDFDSTATALFEIGEYEYDVIFNHGQRTTIAKGNDAVVE